MSEHRPEAWDQPTAWGGLPDIYPVMLDELELKQDDINVIVEIGVDWGFSLTHFATAHPQARVFGVDSWHTEHEEDKPAIQLKVDMVKRDAEHLPNLTILHMDTAEARALWNDPNFFVHIDLLHIDADHSYEAVKRDFELWAPLVREGGVVLFHDIQSHEATVGRFFEELTRDHPDEGWRATMASCGLGAWRKGG